MLFDSFLYGSFWTHSYANSCKFLLKVLIFKKSILIFFLGKQLNSSGHQRSPRGRRLGYCFCDLPFLLHASSEDLGGCSLRHHFTIRSHRIGQLQHFPWNFPVFGVQSAVREYFHVCWKAKAISTKRQIIVF